MRISFQCSMEIIKKIFQRILKSNSSVGSFVFFLLHPAMEEKIIGADLNKHADNSFFYEVLSSNNI